jgi:hypothetical protein
VEFHPKGLGGNMSLTKKALASGLLLILVSSLLGMGGEWREYRFPDGRFSVKFPGEPATQKMEKDGRDVTIVMGVSQDVVFMVAYTDLPEDAVRAAGAEAILSGAQNGYLQGCRGTLVKSSEFTYGRHKGRTLEAKLEPHGFTSGFLLLADNRLYMVFALGPQENADSSGVSQFLGSFKLLK